MLVGKYSRFARWRLLVVAIVLAGIWLPQIGQYWVSTPHYSREIVTSARSDPSGEVLTRFATVDFDYGSEPAPDRVLIEADLILHGRWYQPGFGSRSVHLPFDERDLAFGWPTQQLGFASLQYVDVLLSAYRLSRNARFLMAARDIVNAWSDYESRAIVPRGFVWNDHAIAERVLVLTRYWQLIRNSPLLDDRSAQLLLQFIGRSGRMLMRPDHYTVRTNHGVMEGLALLQISVCFPSLPDSPAFRSAALQRLRSQLSFYQSDEGVVLEHSAGYHVLGAHLLTVLAGYGDYLDPAFRAEVRERMSKACRFLADLRRPDGSVPLIGDTAAEEDSSVCIRQHHDSAPAADHGAELILYPVSGYGIAWYGRQLSVGAAAPQSQTVATWGNFATHAHKHDDDLAIYTWYRGLPVITGSGYWPYGDRLESAALSWRGANAPFLGDEAPADSRQNTLLATGRSQNLILLDLARDEPRSGAKLRREIVMIGPTDWLIVDFAQSPRPEPLTEVWTLYPGWDIDHLLGNEEFEFHHSQASERLAASFMSTDALSVQNMTASAHPFGGWVALSDSPQAITPTTSISVRGRSGVPLLSYWSFDNRGPQARGYLEHWRGPLDWSACLDGKSCTERVVRRGMLLAYESRGSVETASISGAAPQLAARAAINDRYRSMSEEYPYRGDFYPWRVRATLAIAALFIVQELTFALALLARVSTWPAFDRGLVITHHACTICWVALGFWLTLWYFRG